MAESICSILDAVDANWGAIVANCLVVDRSRAFGCANLRSSQESTLDTLMASQERRTAAMDTAPPHDPEF